jgi:transposase
MENNNKKGKPKAYPIEMKKQALEMFADKCAEIGNKRESAKYVAELLGIGCFDTVLVWANRANISPSKNVSNALRQQAELKNLRKENAELKRANNILKAASAFFGAELDRQQKPL